MSHSPALPPRPRLLPRTLLALARPGPARRRAAAPWRLLSLSLVVASLVQAATARAEPPAGGVRDDEDREANPDGDRVVPRGSTRQPVAPLRLSLLGWGSSADSGRRELGFGAVLTLPLARLGLGRAKASPSGSSQADPPSSPPPPSSSSAGEAAGKAQEGAPAKSEAESPSPVRLEASRVRELTRAAMRAARLEGDGDLADLAWRARSSALLPELRLRAIRASDQSARLVPTDTDPLRTQASDGASMLYEARATWRLDRLVFADDEVALERIKLERAELRRRVLRELLEALSAYQRARRKAADAAASSDDRAEAEAREEAAKVALDAMTDGAFSRGSSEP